MVLLEGKFSFEPLKESLINIQIQIIAGGGGERY
jgi:hypothetical protein